MEAIKIEVAGNIAKVTEKPLRITSGAVGLPVEFTFDSQWDGLSKIAVFQACHVRKYMVLEDDATVAPMEIMAKPNVRLNIGVYGVNEDGSVAIPTIWANAGTIREGAVPGDCAGSDIGLAKKYYNQGHLAAENAEASAKKSEAEAGVAETSADRAEAAVNSANEIVGHFDEQVQLTIRNIQGFTNNAYEAARDAAESEKKAEDAAERAEDAAQRADAAADRTESAVTYTPQDLTEEQQAQARENIGAASQDDLYSISARYNSIEDALAGTNMISDGKVATHIVGDSLNIILLEDIASAITINITKDCTLHLNGKTISFTATGAYLNISTPEATINGEVNGSTIRKENATGQSGVIECMVKAQGTNLHVNKGNYILSNVTTASRALVFDFDATSTVDMYGCIINANNPIFTSGVNGNNILHVEDCKFDVTTNYNIFGIFQSASAKKTEVINSEFRITSTGGNNIVAIGSLGGSVSVDSCKVHTCALANGCKSFGIYAMANDVKVTNCYVEADGRNDVNGSTIGTSAIETEGNGSLIINGGYYWGAREALVISGAVRINGGVFEGCQHGGAYMQGSDIKAKNATFRNVDYTGECGWNNSHYGAVYCGSSSNTDINVYFDNCRFESNVHSSHGVTAKETNTEVFLSNCVFDGNFDNDLRADKTCTIYVGKNVAYENIGVPMPDNDTSYHGTIDTTTYANQEFGFETEPTNYENLIDIKTGLLQEKLEQSVLYTSQDLTEEQKSQARENIGAEKSHGTYELIEAFTLEAGTTFERTQEPDGTPYKLERLLIKASAQSSSATYFTNAIQSNGTNIAYVFHSFTAGTKEYGVVEVFQECGYWRSISHSQTTQSHIYGTARYGGTDYTAKHAVSKYPYITRILGAAALPCDVDIEIWGVRANV
jgi:hypothetical protein